MNRFSLIAFLVATMFLAACATTGTTPPTGNTPAPQSNSIIDVAEGAGNFTTLLAAVDAAGLTETLRGDGPFTVFAPTDAAFAALPAGTVDALLMDIPALTDILLYHVVGAEVLAADVGAGLVPSLQGSDIRVVMDDGVQIGNTNGYAMVTTTDVMADNGVIHIIDAVILPPPSIAEIAASIPDFSTLVAALGAADLVDTMAGDGTFTVFAPTNDAFDALPDGTVDALLNDIPALTDILLYHVAGEKLSAADVVAASSVTTLQGSDAPVVVDAAGASIAGAMIVETDIPASNGVIHIIEAVILP